MATTGILNGTALGFWVDGTLVANSTSFTLNLNESVRDATTKDSGGYTDNLEGLRDWSMDGEAMMSFDGAFTFDDLFALWNTRGTAVVMISTEETGDQLYVGTGRLSSLSMTGGVEESATFSFSFTGTGALAENTQT